MSGRKTTSVSLNPGEDGGRFDWYCAVLFGVDSVSIEDFLGNTMKKDGDGSVAEIDPDAELQFS